MNIDMDREDNCLEDYEMYKIIKVYCFILYFQMQFGLVVIYIGYNMMIDCEFFQGFNYVVFIYVFMLIVLFFNFYIKVYFKKLIKNS